MYDISEITKRYVGLTDDQVIDRISEDFGPKAAERLKTFGILTYNEAICYRNEYMRELFDLGLKNPDPIYGNQVGWVINLDESIPSINFDSMGL